jgi:hypothetical protein
MSNRQPVEDLLRRTYRVVADLPDDAIVPGAAPNGLPPDRPRSRRQGVLVAVTVLVLASAGVGLILAVAGSSPASRKAVPPASLRPKTPTAATPGTVTVPNDTSGCAPTSGPGGPAANLTMAGTHVASGTIDGRAWTLYAAKGQAGANAIEDGGLVIGGRAYGLCPGYPNPAELQLIDAGPHALVAGVVGYPGLATVQLAESTVGTFDVGSSLPSPSVQLVDGVSFFIGSLPKSACDYPALELNTTSPGVSAEHNLGFGTCAPDQLVPISASQGIWQLAPGQFPANF